LTSLSRARNRRPVGHLVGERAPSQ